MEAAKQVGALVLISQAALYFGQQFAKAFDGPVERPFMDRLCTSCIGDPEQLYRHGIIPGCSNKVERGATIVNLVTQRNEQVWLCREHEDELFFLDNRLQKSIRWQDLPMPRASPEEKLFRVMDFTRF
jgi:hypothetical protein